MSLSLQQIPFELWRRKSERKGIRPQFNPVFTSYIGVENQGKYNDVLATIQKFRLILTILSFLMVRFS